MMNIQSFAVRALVFTALLGCGRFTFGADRQDRVVSASALRPTMEGAVSAAPIAADFRSMPELVTNVRPHPTAGGIAGTPPGTNVYSNEIVGGGTFYTPGAGDRMADDLILAGGGCDIVYYNLGVFSETMTDDPVPVPTVPFDVTVELWAGDPCEGGTPLHTASFTGVAVGEPQLLEVFPDTPIMGAPNTVWLAATFSTDDAGWIIAGESELGANNNIWSENNTPPPPDPPTRTCARFWFLGDPFAGFWANVNCELAADPTGACCDGTACTEVTAVDCTTGTWQGAFTGCDPSPCVSGACCAGGGFRTCTETTEAACDAGFFDASTGCGSDVCGPNHVCYANDFNTGFFFGIPTNEKWADDIELAPGPPREILGVEVLMTGGGTGAPSTFSATIELWSNNENGTLADPTDDRPGAPIPGFARTVSGIPADQLPHAVLVSAPDGVIVSGRVWVVVTTDTDTAGVLLAGHPSKPGASLDQFALFNSMQAPNEWAPGFFFGGFDGGSACPGDPSGATVCPAGSGRIRVHCDGDPVTGACCDDATGSCTGDVEQLACAGRWEQGLACRANPFTPACGNGACCFPNPINPDAVVCQENTEAECATLNGSFSPGLGCPGSGTVAALSACPGVGCLGQEGDCFAVNPTPSCDDAFCCERVCAIDDLCCSDTWTWDEFCVGHAESVCTPNDDIVDALPIAGEGVFEFNNASATPDGPNHAQCATFGDTVIDNDVWFCWTANCSDVVLLETCNGIAVDPIEVDTKIAAYDGCGDPTNASLAGCSDDTCGFQSGMVFEAQANQDYLVRVGTFPGMPGGPGSFSLSCGVAGCPGDGDCCGGTGTPGCADPFCCAKVCACDPFCCSGEWDPFCAGNGFGDSGCGAAALCTDTCGGTECPSATGAGAAVMAVDPPSGAVDAGIPHDRDDAAALLGINMIDVDAPVGAGSVGCWTLCETDSGASANSVVDVIDNGGGQFTLVLDRPMTPGAATTISYAGDGTVLTFTAHPGNVNADTRTTVADVQELVDILDGTVTPVWGDYSGDIDRSGAIGPGDIFEAIDLINGADAYEPWLNTAKATADGVCP